MSALSATTVLFIADETHTSLYSSCEYTRRLQVDTDSTGRPLQIIHRARFEGLAPARKRNDSTLCASYANTDTSRVWLEVDPGQPHGSAPYLPGPGPECGCC